jgi:sugar phosphate permease
MVEYWGTNVSNLIRSIFLYQVSNIYLTNVSGSPPTIKTIEHGTSDDPNDKKLLRKLDLHLIPTMTLLYLLSYLDRVNIGQAKLDGLTDSLHLTDAQYKACLSVFFATYVIFEIPSNLILKKLRPSRWIPMIMVAWGIVMTLMGLVQSYGGLLACRLALGAVEAGLFPGKKIFIRNI